MFSEDDCSDHLSSYNMEQYVDGVYFNQHVSQGEETDNMHDLRAQTLMLASHLDF